MATIWTMKGNKLTKTNYEKVKEFHTIFGHPVNQKPVVVDTK